MATQQDNEKIIWVMGNRQSVIIPMEQEIIPAEGDPYTEDFYPAEDDTVKVTLTGAYRPYIYTPEVDGNLLIVTDNGTLPKGLYGVQITVTGSNGDTRLRSFWDQQIIVTEKNNSVLKEWDEFKDQPVTARAAVFFFAKGDKGDALTWNDLTPEQKASLKGEKGDKGDQGIQGEKGDQGIQGEKGDKGAKGDKGDKGERGEQGIQGERGEKGEKGDKGDTGATGAQGEKGETGATGAQGVGIASVTFKEVNPLGGNVYTITLTSGSTADFTAPKGAQGVQGIQGATGVGIARATLNADYTLTLTFTDGTSTTTTSIRGEKGDAGTTDYNELINKPDLSLKQDTLVSGTNIKTINNQSILGSGNINIQDGGGGSQDAVLYTEQSLTSEQKTQARTNIGAQEVINDLSDIRSGAALGATAIQSETDPTVPNWAKQSSKPTYTAQEVGALPNSTKYGSTIDLTMDSATYVLTLSLKDQDGTVLNTKTVDLPIESVVVNGRYDAANKKIVLTLQGGSTIDVPVGDLIAGLQTEITSVNMLDADLVDDTNSTHKFVTLQEKQTWNNKSDFSGSYNDLSDKPIIPVVPTNVSAFTNDAGYLTQHQDISNKEDVTTIEEPVDQTDATQPITTLSCDAGKYYRIDVPVETLAVILPAMTDLTTVRTVVIYLTTGNAPAVTISSADAKSVYYQDGFEIEAGNTYEINALFNGAAWVIASVEIVIPTNEGE